MANPTFVLVNPASANGRTGRRWAELSQALRAVVGDFDVAHTERPRQATRLAREALSAGARHVVSVGGDGTHNEVVNGFFNADGAINRDAVLSIVPTGTGGDLRRTLGLPKDPLAAIGHVGGASMRVDAGRLRCVGHDGAEVTRCFINIASFGMSGLVDKFVNESSKALGGRVSFVLGVARASIRYKNQPISLAPDGGEALSRTVNNIAVANGRYFGGGMKIAPGAQMGDGRFDVVVVGDLGALDMARGLPKIYSGNHIGSPGIEVFRAALVRAEPGEAGREILIDMDGEQPGRLPATFELLPGALRVGVGPDVQIDVPAAE